MAWDAPDHGTSADAPDATPESHRAALIEHVRGIEGPVVLVGHSYGGWLASHVAGAGLPQVVGLAVLGGFASLPEPIAAILRQTADGLESGALSKEAFIAAGTQSWLHADPSAEGRTLVDRCLSSESAGRIARALRRAASLRGDAEPGRVEVPCVSLHCELDAGVPVTLGEHLARRIGARWELLAGSGHIPWLSHPERVASVLLDLTRSRA